MGHKTAENENESNIVNANSDQLTQGPLENCSALILILQE